MNKVIRLGMVFDEDDVPDFGSIVEDVHQMGLYYLLARDIPKLNTMLTRAAAENYLIDNEAFAFFSGYMAYVIDHKEAGTGEIYAYHRGKDRWYEFNIRLDKNFNEIIWERHKRILRETKTISGTAPLTFICNKSGTLKNYRIYGNTITVSGESKSVGDKTINLFDKTKQTDNIILQEMLTARLITIPHQAIILIIIYLLRQIQIILPKEQTVYFRQECISLTLKKIG